MSKDFVNFLPSARDIIEDLHKLWKDLTIDGINECATKCHIAMEKVRNLNEKKENNEVVFKLYSYFSLAYEIFTPLMAINIEKLLEKGM